MRVLVTGHNGFIGSVMVDVLARAGHEIVGFLVPRPAQRDSHGGLACAQKGIETETDWKERVVADLDADDREKIPTKDFGFPEKARTKDAKKQSGNYPMPDKAHARNAKSRAAQAQRAGNLTKKDQERIDRKADKILDK